MEKFSGLHLPDGQPVYTQMADKIAARDFVAARVGESYLIPEIARYDRAEDVDWVLDGEFGGKKREVEIENLEKRLYIVRG